MSKKVENVNLEKENPSKHARSSAKSLISRFIVCVNKHKLQPNACILAINNGHLMVKF